jgi:multiple sugar transport system permease protein
VAPYLLFFGLFIFLPGVTGVALSLFRWDITGDPAFVGIENYVRIADDLRFQAALRQTIYYTTLAGVPFVGLALALALFLNREFRLRGVVRTFLFAPYVAMVSVIGMIWLYLYDPNWGLINFYLQLIGLPKIPWLTSVGTAMPAIVIASLWWLLGVNTVIYLAGLQDIPGDYYDAAKIDGADTFQMFRHITLPLLRNIHALVIPLTIIGSFRVFGQVYVMTQGGPEGSTRVLLQYIYETGFREFYMGRASAAAVVLLSMSLVLTLCQLKLLKQI